MVDEVSAALDILKPLFRHEVDPKYFGSVLSVLVYLTMEEFYPKARKVSQVPGLSDENSGRTVARYAQGIATGGWQMARRMHARITATELGRLIDRVVRRQSRRAFTLLAVGDRPALAMILAQIMKEVEYADNRTVTGGHEVHEEEAW